MNWSKMFYLQILFATNTIIFTFANKLIKMANPKVNNFNSLYTKNYKKAFLFTKSYVHDESVAEDIVAESFIKIWEKLKEEEIDYSDYLLLSILKNKALNYLKHEEIKIDTINSLTDISKRELQLSISTLQACVPEEIFSNDVREIITKTLNVLPQQTRRIFNLSRFQYKGNKEIAQILNLSEKSIEYHISKALKVLRVNLKDYLPLFYFIFFEF